MAAPRASWGLVATVAEPAPLVAAMAVHNIAQGAAEVHLYLDRPTPNIRKLLKKFRQVRITLCDAGYWHDGGRRGRPKNHLDRQITNANDAYRKSEVDWLLHCDADEFVSGPAPLGEALAALPETIDCARLRNVERCFVEGQPPEHIFDGVFRLPFGDLRKKVLSPLIYPNQMRYLDHGVTGYHVGKCLTRTGKGHTILIHEARAADADGRDFLVRPTLQGHRLLHYDGITPLHYQIKMMRHADVTGPESRPRWHKSRVQQVLRANALRDQPKPLELYLTSLRRVTRLQARLLTAFGHLYQAPELPLAAVRRLCPKAEVSEAEFDAILHRREAGLIEATGSEASIKKR